MILKNILVLALVTVSLLLSCQKEDTVEPLRDVQEQSLADDQSIEDFLSSHFYNYDDFSDPAYNGGVVFDTLQNENALKTPLSSQVSKEVINVKTADGNFIDHSLYYLIAREGTGISPATVDSTYLSYEGLLLNKTVFDSSNTPVWFDLTSVVRGFREGAHKFKSGDFKVNEDNTVDFFGYGQGAIFFPLVLDILAGLQVLFQPMPPFIFKINLYGVNQTDHDGDGILSADEFDNDGDGVPDDTDEDGTPDYLDAD